MYAWNDTFLSPYESAWGVLQKFSWLNEANPMIVIRDLAAAYFNGNRSDANHNETFVDLRWIERPDKERSPKLPPCDEASEHIRRTLQERDGVSYFGWLSEVLISEELKVCPICLSMGYHSVAHQLYGLRRCPIHEVELTCECPKCRRRLGLFAPSARFRAFLCPHCRQSFLPDGELMSRSGAENMLVDERISELVDWLQSFADESIDWPNLDYNAAFRVAYQPPAMRTSLTVAFLWCLHKLRPFKAAPRLFHSEAAGLVLERFGRPKEIYAWDDGLHYLQRRQLNELHKEFRENIQAILDEDITYVQAELEEHQWCIQDLMRLMTRGDRAPQFYLTPQSGLCGFAQAFHLWVMESNHLLEDFVQSAAAGWNPLLDTQMHEILLRTFHGMFYSCAQRVAFSQQAFKDKPSSKYTPIGVRFNLLFGLDRDIGSCRTLAETDSVLIFRLTDRDTLKYLMCDGGKAARTYLIRKVSASLLMDTPKLL